MVGAKLMRDNSLKDGETRKLQVTGGSTYVLSLPKRWVTQNGLEKDPACGADRRVRDDRTLEHLGRAGHRQW